MTDEKNEKIVLKGLVISSFNLMLFIKLQLFRVLQIIIIIIIILIYFVTMS